MSGHERSAVLAEIGIIGETGSSDSMVLLNVQPYELIFGHCR